MPRYIDAKEFERRMQGVYEEYMWDVLEDTPTANVPESNVEKLTDEEQRIFLAAMAKEETVCKNIEDLWDQLSLSSDDDIDLVKICEEIERKVKKALWT